MPPTSRAVLVPFLAGACLLLAPPAAGQGSDDCAGATQVLGGGPFDFDLTGATTDGLPDAACSTSGNHIENDVWFTWRAPTTGPRVVQTCELTGVDTALAIYAGTACPASAPVACDDDTCGAQSRVFLDAVAGVEYLVRIGTAPGAAPGAGQWEIWDEPGGDCDPWSAGPDVITGELPGIFHWGAIGGVSAYSIGADACNVGDQRLPWDGATSQHPVIAQNLYRLKDGRFEQLGQSWVKHGFSALNVDTCCDCVTPGVDTWLKVGCSDAYGPVQNGEQPTLAPRWEVDPHTGAFPFPASTMGQTGDTLYKRVQVANDDLDPALNPGALYFAEGQYVGPGDADAGNGDNNASYREAVVGDFQNGGWKLSLTGMTQRRAAAIQAWRDHVPGVKLEQVPTPGDGLYLVGSHAFQGPSGSWRYEYAVQNVDAARGARGLRVPVPPGAAVHAPGFHDVDGHSGDPYSNQDWELEQLADGVRWSTRSFTEDPRANALRWGTLYSFWFESPSPPQLATATLELFAPGVPMELLVEVHAPSPVDGCDWTAYCSSLPNSQGAGAAIFASGSTSVSAGDFELHGAGGVPDQPGLFYYGGAPAQLPFGDGLRCVGPGGAGLFRLGPPAAADGSGSSALLVDFQRPPAGAGPGAITAGSTWYFQWWYRDPAGPGGSGFNLSDGLAARFCR